MKRSTRSLVGGITFCLALPMQATAQTVVAADAAVLQPLVYRDGPTITGCGLRGMIASASADQETFVVDFSVTANAKGENMNGLGKAGAYRTKAAARIDPKSALNVISFFVSSEDGSLNVAPTKFIPADNKGFVLGGVEVVAAANVLFALQDGQRFQVGVQVAGEPLARVYSFNAEMPEADQNTFMSCMTGLMASIKANSPSEERAP